MKNLNELQAAMNDSRIHLSEHKGVFYADVVEENGDEHGLAKSDDLADLEEQLRSFGYVGE